MFTTLKRQWRIVTPLVTALVAVSIVVSAFLVPASAHTKTVFFRYSGDAADFVNYTENPAFFDCFSGYLGPDGSGGTTIDASLDNCTDAGFTSGTGFNQVTLFADVAAWNVHAFHTKTEGHADATAADVGDGAVFFDNFIGLTPLTPILLATDGSTNSGNCFSSKTTTAIPNTFLPRVGYGCIFAFDEVRTTAEAECQSNHNHLSSSAVSKTAVHDLGLFGDNSEFEDPTHYVNAFTNIATGGHTVQFVRTDPVTGFTVIFTFNEQIKDVGRSFADISANGVHIIEQDGAGNIAINVVVAHTHADIECDFQSFNFEDPIGA